MTSDDHKYITKKMSKKVRDQMNDLKLTTLTFVDLKLSILEHMLHVYLKKTDISVYNM